MKGQSAGSGGGAASMMPLAGGLLFGGKAKETNKEFDKLNKSTKKSYTALGMLANVAGKVLGGAFNLLASAVTTVIGSFISLGAELINGGNRLTDFAKHLPIPGLTLLTSLLDDQIDMYRMVSNAGAGFGNSIIEIARVSAQAAMNQQEFLQFVAQNSEEIKRFGSTVQGGGRLFADMSKRLRQSQMGINLMNLGFTAGELNQNLIEFSEIAQMSGTRQRLSTDQLINGSLSYSQTLDSLSRMTGKHRDLIAQQVKDMMGDVDLQRAVQMYGEEFAAALAGLPQGTESLSKAIIDMVDGIPNDDVTKGFMLASKTFQEGASRFGEMSLEEKNAFLAKVSKETTAYVDSLSVEQQQALRRSGGIMAQIVEESGNLRKVTEADLEKVKSEQAEKDKVTQKLTQFEQTIQNIRDKIKLALIDSGIFESVTDAISNFIPNAEEANTMYATANKWFNDNILPSLKSIYDWFTKEGEDGTTGIKNFLDWFQNDAMPAAKEAFSFLTKLATAEGREEMKNKFIDSIKEWAQGVTKGALNWISDPGNLVQAFTTAFLLLSPGGMIMGAIKLIVAGLVNFLDWENIWKDLEGVPLLGPMIGFIKDSAKSIGDFFGNLFGGIDFAGMIGSYIPDWVKKWLPDDWFNAAGSTPQPPDNAAENPTPATKNDETNEVEQVTEKKTVSSSSPDMDDQSVWDMLSTKLDQLIGVSKDQVVQTKKLQGNLHHG